LGCDGRDVVVNDKCHKFLLDGLASKDPSFEEESKLEKQLASLEIGKNDQFCGLALLIVFREENFRTHHTQFSFFSLSHKLHKTGKKKYWCL
jgi:hypothetical protein